MKGTLTFYLFSVHLFLCICIYGALSSTGIFGSAFRTILLLAGIHSFDCLGLGYRVDWPLSIILSPGALKMYSDIFSFLIQVKLAAFSLSDIWRSLKVLI